MKNPKSTHYTWTYCLPIIHNTCRNADTHTHTHTHHPQQHCHVGTHITHNDVDMQSWCPWKHCHTVKCSHYWQWPQRRHSPAYNTDRHIILYCTHRQSNVRCCSGTHRLSPRVTVTTTDVKLHDTTTDGHHYPQELRHIYGHTCACPSKDTPIVTHSHLGNPTHTHRWYKTYTDADIRS